MHYLPMSIEEFIGKTVESDPKNTECYTMDEFNDLYMQYLEKYDYFMEDEYVEN